MRMNKKKEEDAKDRELTRMAIISVIMMVVFIAIAWSDSLAKKKSESKVAYANEMQQVIDTEEPVQASDGTLISIEIIYDKEYLVFINGDDCHMYDLVAVRKMLDEEGLDEGRK